MVVIYFKFWAGFRMKDTHKAHKQANLVGFLPSTSITRRSQEFLHRLASNTSSLPVDSVTVSRSVQPLITAGPLLYLNAHHLSISASTQRSLELCPFSHLCSLPEDPRTVSPDLQRASWNVKHEIISPSFVLTHFTDQNKHHTEWPMREHTNALSSHP